MSSKFLRFEDGKISLGSKDLLVQSANLSISPKLQAERVYGDFDPNIVGAKTEFVDFSPVGNLQGSLDISFLISAESFSSDQSINSVDRLFDIADGMSEAPINDNLVGRYSFDNMYLKSFSFDVAPFKMVRANATYDIYGTIRRDIDRRFHKTQTDFAHTLKSFGSITASGLSSEEIEILGMKYNIIVNRKIYNKIRGNEHTSINTSADGAVPARVSIETIEKEMSIESNEIVENLNAYGNPQNLSVAEPIVNSYIAAYLLSLGGDKIAKFDISGKITSQSMSISEGQNARASIAIKQIIK